MVDGKIFFEIANIDERNLPESTVINTSAEMAPRNTVRRECFMAMIAAMKNVLSPISETIMTDSDATKA